MLRELLSSGILARKSNTFSPFCISFRICSFLYVLLFTVSRLLRDVLAAGQKQTFTNVPPEASELVDEFVTSLVAYKLGYNAGVRRNYQPELNAQGIPYQQQSRRP